MPPSWCLFPQKCLMRSLAKGISLRVDIGDIWTANVSLYHMTKLFWQNVVYWTLYLPPTISFIQIPPTKITLEMFFLPISRSEAEKLRSWIAWDLIIWRHFRKLPSAKTRKNFKGVLFSFCAEEKYNIPVAVKSTKTMNNSGHLTFLLTQQV